MNRQDLNLNSNVMALRLITKKLQKMGSSADKETLDMAQFFVKKIKEQTKKGASEAIKKQFSHIVRGLESIFTKVKAEEDSEGKTRSMMLKAMFIQKLSSIQIKWNQLRNTSNKQSKFYSPNKRRKRQKNVTNIRTFIGLDKPKRKPPVPKMNSVMNNSLIKLAELS